MRGSFIVASLVLVAATSGCFGADVHVEPQLSRSETSDSLPPPPKNDPPLASFVLLNESGVEAPRHYTGDKLTADASISRDPDGSIANYTWRILRFGYFDADFGAVYGKKVNLSFDAPGDRTLVLQVVDDKGAAQSEYLSFGVNQHRVETGTLLLGQAPSVALPGGVAQAPVGAKNFSLPIVAGVLALSINATFPTDPAAIVRLEIHAPNGTIINRSEGSKSPLWAIAAPVPGVTGNYTAHMSLVTGAAIEYRLEYVAWYGFS
jgi:hypothetical protein